MRRLFILLCCIMLMVALACSASAVALGWEDYVVDHGKYPDGTPYAWCEFPADMGRFNIYNGNTFLEASSGGHMYYSWSAGQIPRVRYLPLGQQGTSAVGVGKLVLDPRPGDNTYGIPNGVELGLALLITNDANQWGNFTVQFSVAYYDANESFLSEDIVERQVSGYFPLDFGIDYTVNAPYGAVFVAFYVDIRSNVTLTSSLNNVGVSASKLTMIGDGLEYHDWKVTLDDINNGINGPANPINPDQLPDCDLEDQENFFAGLGNDLFGSIADFFDNVVNDLAIYGTGFLVIMELFSLMLKYEVVGFLINLSVSLGILAFILNITPSIVDKFDRDRVARNRFREWQRTGGKGGY